MAWGRGRRSDQAAGRGRARDPGPGKAPDRVFFDLFGLTTITYPVWLGGVMLALGLGGCVAAMRGGALREIGNGNTDPFYLGKLQTARFYFAKLFPETASLMRTARAGSKSLMDTDAALA